MVSRILKEIKERVPAILDFLNTHKGEKVHYTAVQRNFSLPYNQLALTIAELRKTVRYERGFFYP